MNGEAVLSPSLLSGGSLNWPAGPATTAYSPSALRQTFSNPYSRENQRAMEEDYYLSKAFGDLGMRRIREFQDYPEGWGDGTKAAASPAAFRRMLAFAKSFAFPAAKIRPSVFFTGEGGFEIEWESENAETIQVEFAPDRIEVFHAGRGLDLILQPDEMEQLFALLS